MTKLKQTYVIILSQVHPHNISQGKASLEDKQSNVIQAQNFWLTDKETSPKFHVNLHSSDFYDMLWLTVSWIAGDTFF